MQIKNNTVANLSVYAKSTRGKTAKKYLTIPGEATLHLEDQIWLEEFAEAAAPQLKAGMLTITVAPAKSEEQIAEEEAAALEAAKKLVAKAAAKAKADSAKA